MGRTKNRWKISRLFSYGLHLVNGDHDPYYTVSMTFELERDEDRLLDFAFTDEDHAERVARSLLEYVYKVREHNVHLAAARFRNSGGETDTHTEHCCKWHGCKYAYDGSVSKAECTVMNGTKPQSFTCEKCEYSDR